MIGEKFKSISTSQGKTLRDVEKMTGISNAYLSQLENGKIKHPSYKVVQNLLEYYGIKNQPNYIDEITMLISTMTEIEVDNLVLFAKHILNNRKREKISNT